MGLSAFRSLRALTFIITAVSAHASSYGSSPYRDASLPVDDRVEDLLSRMTIEEKAGQLFHLGISMGPNGTLAPASEDGNSTEFMVGEQHISYFNYIGIVDDPRQTAQWYNRLQQRALETRLGIPIIIATDPRHTVSTDILTSYWQGAFSAWPDSLGLAALRDPALVEPLAMRCDKSAWLSFSRLLSIRRLISRRSTDGAGPATPSARMPISRHR